MLTDAAINKTIWGWERFMEQRGYVAIIVILPVRQGEIVNAPGCVQQSGAFAIEERHNGFRSAEKVRLEARATSRNGWESAETRSWKTENFPCQRLDIPDGMCYFFADQMVNKNLSTY